MPWKKYLNPQTAVALLAILAGIFIFAVHKVQTYKNRPGSDQLNYRKLVTSADRAPLEIPKAVVKAGRTVKVPILMYHHVGDFPAQSSRMRKDLTVSTDDFAAQAKWLAENGYQTIHLNDIYLYSQGKFKMPPKPLVFTFDDGYADVFENAIPVLKKYNFTGSFGIITRYPKAQSKEQQGDNFYAAWEQIVRAKQDGMEIICHTQNHFDGTNKKYSMDFIFQNLNGCQNDIQERLGAVEPVMIYPYGHYSSAYIEQAKKAGLSMGVSVHEGDTINLDNLMEVPRVRVHGKEDFERFKRLVKE